MRLWAVVAAIFIAIFTIAALHLAASGYSMLSLLLLVVIGIVLEDMRVK